MDLEDSTILITGGLGSLGLDMIDSLHARCRNLVVLDLETKKKASTAFNDLANVRYWKCDVSKYEEVNRVFSKIIDALGVPNVLINNASLLHSEPLLGFSTQGLVVHDSANWQRVIRAGLDSVFCMSRSFAEGNVKARQRGVIVNISSIAANGNIGQSAYSAAKAGVNALTKIWAGELGNYGIRVVGVAPGYLESASANKATTESHLKKLVSSQIPMRRLGKLREISNTVIFAIENEYLTGKILEIDGGLRL